MFKVMSKAFAIVLALLLVAGALVANTPIQASTSEGDEGSDSGSNEDSGNDEGGGGDPGGETEEPEPEPEPAPPVVTEKPIPPVEPAIIDKEVKELECPEDFVLNEQRDKCIAEADASTADLPAECEGMTPLECLGEKVGAPPPECDNLEPLQCLDLLNKEGSAPVVEPEPIDPCLLDPGHESCPEPVDGQCPPGYNMNEDEQCYPEHPNGCPPGYHSHEDDESGKCIPNSTPCDKGYILTPNGKSCEKKERVCEEFPNAKGCGKDDNGNGKDKDKKIIIIKKIIKNVDIVKKIDKSNDDLDIKETIVAIDYENGAGLNCVIDEDDKGQCETFDVTKDKGKEPLLQVIPFE